MRRSIKVAVVVGGVAFLGIVPFWAVNRWTVIDSVLNIAGAVVLFVVLFGIPYTAWVMFRDRKGDGLPGLS